ILSRQVKALPSDLFEKRSELLGAPVQIPENVERTLFVLLVIPETHTADLDLFRSVEYVHIPESFALQPTESAFEIEDLAADYVWPKIPVRSRRVPFLAYSLGSVHHDRYRKTVTLAGMLDQALSVLRPDVRRIDDGKLSPGKPLVEHVIQCF